MNLKLVSTPKKIKMHIQRWTWISCLTRVVISYWITSKKRRRDYLNGFWLSFSIQNTRKKFQAVPSCYKCFILFLNWYPPRVIWKSTMICTMQSRVRNRIAFRRRQWILVNKRLQRILHGEWTSISNWWCRQTSFFQALPQPENDLRCEKRITEAFLSFKNLREP